MGDFIQDGWSSDVNSHNAGWNKKLSENDHLPPIVSAGYRKTCEGLFCAFPELGAIVIFFNENLVSTIVWGSTGLSLATVASDLGWCSIRCLRGMGHPCTWKNRSEISADNLIALVIAFSTILKLGAELAWNYWKLYTLPIIMFSAKQDAASLDTRATLRQQSIWSNCSHHKSGTCSQ